MRFGSAAAFARLTERRLRRRQDPNGRVASRSRCQTACERERSNPSDNRGRVARLKSSSPPTSAIRTLHAGAELRTRTLRVVGSPLVTFSAHRVLFCWSASSRVESCSADRSKSTREPRMTAFSSIKAAPTLVGKPIVAHSRRRCRRPSRKLGALDPRTSLERAPRSRSAAS